MDASSDLATKYTPLRLSEFIGNDDEIATFIRILKDPDVSSILLMGPNGSGKTVLCNLIAKELHLQLTMLNFEHCSTHTDIKTIVDHALFTKSVTDFLTATNKVVVLDDVEIILTNDRLFQSYILDVLQKHKSNRKMKLIIVVSKSEERKVNDIKKAVSKIIKIDNPSDTDCLGFLKGVCANENMSTSDAVIKQHMYQFQNNVRNLLLNMSSIGSSQESLHRGFFDMNIYEIIHKVFSDKHQHIIRDIDLLCSYEPVLISLLLYDNLTTYIKKFSKKIDTGTCASLESKFNHLVTTFINASIIENYCFNSYESVCSQIPNILKCVSIVLTPSQIKMKDVKPVFQDNIYKFTQILTKTALNHSMLKKLYRLETQSYLSSSSLVILADLTASEKPTKTTGKKSELASVLNTYTNLIQDKNKNSKTNK